VLRRQCLEPSSALEPEQVVEIVAQETPEASSASRRHWTPAELAVEAVKRGIVERISVRSVGRFLKEATPTTNNRARYWLNANPGLAAF